MEATQAVINTDEKNEVIELLTEILPKFNACLLRGIYRFLKTEVDNPNSEAIDHDKTKAN